MTQLENMRFHRDSIGALHVMGEGFDRFSVESDRKLSFLSLDDQVGEDSLQDFGSPLPSDLSREDRPVMGFVTLAGVGAMWLKAEEVAERAYRPGIAHDNGKAPCVGRTPPPLPRVLGISNGACVDPFDADAALTIDQSCEVGQFRVIHRSVGSTKLNESPNKSGIARQKNGHSDEWRQ